MTGRCGDAMTVISSLKDYEYWQRDTVHCQSCYAPGIRKGICWESNVPPKFPRIAGSKHYRLTMDGR